MGRSKIEILKPKPALKKKGGPKAQPHQRSRADEGGADPASSSSSSSGRAYGSIINLINLLSPQPNPGPLTLSSHAYSTVQYSTPV